MNAPNIVTFPTTGTLAEAHAPYTTTTSGTERFTMTLDRYVKARPAIVRNAGHAAYIVLTCLLDHTFGWGGRDHDHTDGPLPLSLIAEETGISRNSVCGALKELQRLHVIAAEQRGNMAARYTMLPVSAWTLSASRVQVSCTPHQRPPRTSKLDDQRTGKLDESVQLTCTPIHSKEKAKKTTQETHARERAHAHEKPVTKPGKPAATPPSTGDVDLDAALAMLYSHTSQNGKTPWRANADKERALVAELCDARVGQPPVCSPALLAYAAREYEAWLCRKEDEDEATGVQRTHRPDSRQFHHWLLKALPDLRKHYHQEQQALAQQRAASAQAQQRREAALAGRDNPGGRRAAEARRRLEAEQRDRELSARYRAQANAQANGQQQGRAQA